MQNQNKFVALLRGINVGGNKKVPMADLKSLLESMGYMQVKTLLNSGNVVFDSTGGDQNNLAAKLSTAIERKFGFQVLVIVQAAQAINSLIELNPFSQLEVHKDIRLYVTFLSNQTITGKMPEPDYPWSSPENSFTILEKKEDAVFSVLDVSKIKTPDAMMVLEKIYSKDITTRNWKTVEKIGKACVLTHPNPSL
jgi:uncharacterized protein (DUF1697 family)